MEIKKILILFYIGLFLTGSLFSLNTIGAISNITLCDFDDVSAGLDSGSTGYVTWQNTGVVNTFETTTDFDLSSPNGLIIKGVSGGDMNGWVNLTTNFDYISVINISFWCQSRNSGTDNFNNVSFWKDGVKQIEFKLENDFYWFEFTMPNMVGSGAWTESARYYIIITHLQNNIFNITLKNSAFGIQCFETDVSGTNAADWTTFDSIYFDTRTGAGDAAYFIWDNIKISTESGSTGGCDEDYKDDQWIGTGFQSCLGTVLLQDVFLPSYYIEKYIELVNGHEINGDVSGFEIAISPSMDNDLTNYYLYINGMSIGNPCESEGFLSGTTALDKLKWDISGLTLQNESVVVELYHDSLSWNLGYNGDSTNVYGPPFPDVCIYHSHNNYIDGIMNYNITQVKKRAMYKIYFSNVSGGGENPNYDNSIVVKGKGVNVTDGIQWTNKYDTVYFDIHINDTIYDYYINVYKDGVAVGENQYYPIYITSYQEVHGYTPEDIGLYKVILLRTGDYEVLNETFWVKNITAIESKYILYTAPNPSFMNNDYTVFVLIDDGDIYNNYYARSFVYSTDTFYYDRGFGGSTINTIGDLTSFNFAHNEGNVDYHYWRIFGTNDDITFLPLGDVYTHYIDRSLIDSPYISLSTYTIQLGDTVNILGFHPIGFNYAIFIGSTNVFDVSNEINFNKLFKPSNKGIYTITLKNKVDNSWIIPNNDCRVTLNVLENTSGGGGGGVFSIVIPQPYSYFAGIFVILLFTLSPLAMVIFMGKSTGREFNISSIPQVLYLILAIIGFVVTIVLEWFPVWTIAVLVVMCIVIIAIMWLQKKNVTEG